jgi:hypothetical protein
MWKSPTPTCLSGVHPCGPLVRTAVANLSLPLLLGGDPWRNTLTHTANHDVAEGLVPAYNDHDFGVHGRSRENSRLDFRNRWERVIGDESGSGIWRQTGAS